MTAPGWPADGKSACCAAPMVVRGRTTRHWECTACGDACDRAPDGPAPEAAT